MENLKEMFQLQKGWMDALIKAGKLPLPYPLPINSRESQTLLKSLINSLIEELAEVHQVYRLMVENFDTNSSAGELKVLLREFNEEVADVTHFFLEVLIYSHINDESLLLWYKRLAREVGREDLAEDFDFTLDMGFIMAGYEYNNLMAYNDFHRLNYSIPDMPDTLGGNAISLALAHAQAGMLWDITYNIQLAANCLKNNPWRQIETITDADAYHGHLFTAWRAFMFFLYYFKFNSHSIYTQYKLKNEKNLNRLNSGR